MTRMFFTYYRSASSILHPTLASSTALHGRPQHNRGHASTSKHTTRVPCDLGAPADNYNTPCTRFTLRRLRLQGLQLAIRPLFTANADADAVVRGRKRDDQARERGVFRLRSETVLRAMCTGMLCWPLLCMGLKNGQDLSSTNCGPQLGEQASRVRPKRKRAGMP